MSRELLATELVYFLRQPYNGRIKIGYTTDFAGRLTALEIGAGCQLELLAVEAGTRERERELHHRFAGARVFGEWFEPVEGLMEHIEALGPPQYRESAPKPSATPGPKAAALPECQWRRLTDNTVPPPHRAAWDRLWDWLLRDPEENRLETESRSHG